MRKFHCQLWVRVAIVLAISVAAVGATHAQAPIVREFEQDGIRYRETRQVTKRPITDVQYEQQQRTVYKEKYDTRVQTNYRTVMTPITEYKAEPYLANRWNPFATPYWTYQYIPTTRWEAAREEIKVPITQRNWVPEQQTVTVPKTTQRLVEEEVISKVAIGTVNSGVPGSGNFNNGAIVTNPSSNGARDPFAPSGQNAVANRNSAWGGVRLDAEPPRDAQNAWRPAEPIRR